MGLFLTYMHMNVRFSLSQNIYTHFISIYAWLWRTRGT